MVGLPARSRRTRGAAGSVGGSTCGRHTRADSRFTGAGVQRDEATVPSSRSPRASIEPRRPSEACRPRARPAVEAFARAGRRCDLTRLGLGRGAVDLVEVRDDVGDFRQLGDIDFASTNEIEHEVAELGERVVTPAVRAQIVEPRPAFARASLDRVADHAGLRERRAK